MLDNDPTLDDLDALEPVEDTSTTKEENDAFWDDDENLADERYAGNGIPSWSVWAE